MGQDYKWVPYQMSEQEIVEIRTFGNPNHLYNGKHDDVNDVDDNNGRIESERESINYNEVKNGDDVDDNNGRIKSERGSIDYNEIKHVDEEIIYKEIVGEIDHFQHSSLMGKTMHIVVFIAFITFFGWCV